MTPEERERAIQRIVRYSHNSEQEADVRRIATALLRHLLARGARVNCAVRAPVVSPHEALEIERDGRLFRLEWQTRPWTRRTKPSFALTPDKPLQVCSRLTPMFGRDRRAHVGYHSAPQTAVHWVLTKSLELAEAEAERRRKV